MPANLTPEYLEAEAQFKTAKSPQEKLGALEEMLATIPKHKGTEKMQAEIKRRIARLKTDMEERRGPARRSTIAVEREGAAQVCLAGLPNSGKSSLLALLTNAKPEIGEYPFTTRLPHPGMMPYEDVQIQLVDLPPLMEGVTESWEWEILKRGDMLLLVVDAGSDESLGMVEELQRLLESARILVKGLNPLTPPSASARFVSMKPAIVAANRSDIEGGWERGKILRELFQGQGRGVPVVPVSCAEKKGIEELRQTIFRELHLIRVYSKIPGHDPDYTKPYVVREGSTLLDLASLVHKDFAEKLKYARVWGSGIFSGQRVKGDHVLRDRDVVELHL